MGYNDIFYDNEEKYYDINQLKFKKFIELFKEVTKIDASNLFLKQGIKETDYCSQFYYLKYIVFIYYPHLVKEFYNLLEIEGFDISSEIIDAIKTIGRNTISRLDSDVVDYLKICPYINSITSNNGLITIHSDEFGDYGFYPSKYYFSSNEDIIDLLNKYQTQGFCHQISWAVLNELTEGLLLTLKLPSYFEGTFYHTVIQDNDNMIIDLANESVMNVDTHSFLCKSKVVSETLKKDLNKALKEALEDQDEISKSEDYANAMLLALHAESKRVK